MKIHKLNVQNFRGLENSEITFSDLTALIGENNAGKSSFLAAIVAFYQGSKSIPNSDYYNGDTNRDIEITITFGDLTPVEREAFSADMVDGRLIVTRTFSNNKPDISGKFNSTVMGNPEFGQCRDKTLSKTAAREKYDEIREKYELPKVSSADQIEGHLQKWEGENPDKLKLTKIGGFRGFQSVGRAELERKTKFLFVPAITNVQSVMEDKGAPIIELVNTITRQVFENDPEFKTFQDQVNEDAKKVTDPSKSDELGKLAIGLNSVLLELYSDSEVELNWEPVNHIEVPLPKSSILVQNHQHKAPIDKVGHGLQRAVFLSALRYLAERDNSESPEEEKFLEAQSDIIIGIEEPELYQHPVKQQLFAQIFRKSVERFNATNGIRVQIIITTHSAAFVDFSFADEIRLLRRVEAEVDGQKIPSTIQVTSCDISECSAIVAKYLGLEPSEQTYRKSLHIITREITEAFFGKKVLIVEGVGDKVIMQATYNRLGRSPEREGIVIIDTGGKSKIDKPALILRQLGIPSYVVFDNDETNTKKSGNTNKTESEANYNKLLQRIQDVPEADISEWPVYVGDKVACWDSNLERYLQNKVGHDVFNDVCSAKQEEYGGKKRECLKNPTIMREIVEELYSKGFKFGELEEIVLALDKL
jgi:predicted ATP-dependent endonuclease of OLD family